MRFTAAWIKIAVLGPLGRESTISSMPSKLIHAMAARGCPQRLVIWFFLP